MPFRFGLIGAGVAAEIHIPAMRCLPGVQVVGIADVNLARADAIAKRYGIPRVYETTEALLADARVDAVDILTPHHLHLPAVKAAAKAGKHVLVEKAMAPTVAAADEMIAVCRAHGVALGGIFQNRFTPGARALRQTVQGGLLGRIFLASASVKLRRSLGYYQRAAWRGRRDEAGGGVLMIQAIHTLDLLQWVMGMPRSVLARTATVLHPVEVEDLAVAVLEWDSGAVAVLQATTAAPLESPPEIEIHGDRGVAAVFDNRGELAFWSSTPDRPSNLPDRWTRYAAEFRDQDPAAPSQASPEPHAENIRDFVAAVREGRSPLVDGEEARRAPVIIEALYRSQDTRRWVEVDRGDTGDRGRSGGSEDSG
jgi:predicted dehydrogenase